MYGVVLKNKSKDEIYRVYGYNGSDWCVTANGAVIPPGGELFIGGMSTPLQGASDHWGWISLSVSVGKVDPAATPSKQVYIAAGTDRGMYDYAVQKYEAGGHNRNGTSLPGYGLERIAGYFNGVEVTVEPAK